jgi:hypothetical protein
VPDIDWAGRSLDELAPMALPVRSTLDLKRGD